MATAKKKGLNPKLVKAVQDLLDEVMARPKGDAEAKFSLTDKTKVIDRFVAIEKLRLGLEDDGEGSFFGKGGHGDE